MSDGFFPTLASWFDERTPDSIEVVRMFGDMKPPATGQPGIVVGERVFACGRGSRVLDVTERFNCLALLRGLPDADVARCHEPGFGLRVTTGGETVGVTLCFECSNAYVGDTLHAFAATSRPAAALLAFLRSLEFELTG